MNISRIVISSFDGLKLQGYFFKSKNQTKQTIIFTHGISEYALRHDYLISRLGDKYNILFHDLRGHGESEGDKGYVDSFIDYEKDLMSWINYYHHQLDSQSNVHLMGHSMGGLITLGSLESTDALKFVQSIFLSAPAIGVGDSLGVFLQKYMPTSIISNLGKALHKTPLKGRVDIKQLSHSHDLEESYDNDPMILTKLSARLLTQLLVRSSYISKYNFTFEQAIKIVVGSGDQIISVKKITSFSQSHQQKLNINTVLIKDALHEMHFEIPEYQDQYFLELDRFFS